MSISKQSWTFVTLVVAGLSAGGCAEPDQIITASPPGVNPRDAMIPKEEPSEALGETGRSGGETSAKSAVLSGLVPAPPTAKGETKTTPSDVSYETIKEGTGEEAVAGKHVTVHYVGTLDDGRKFDSSRDKNHPFTTSIGTGNVVKGWDEGVPGMKVGEIRKLTIPPAAGYGALGSGERVPPNATLHFEIELLGVK